MAQGSTMIRHRSRGAKSPTRDVDQLVKSLGTLPRILCWKCRQLTSFELDRCQHCGSAFAGGTGGAYRSGRKPTSDSRVRAAGGSGLRPRSLRDIVEDLQRVRDLADSPREPPQDEEVSLLLYQCPSCARFVSQASEDCACGVRFAPASDVTFQCPECGSNVPSGEDLCPICRVEFRAASLEDHLVYSCPRCGTQVDSDAIRCSCGAWFEE